MLAVIGDLVDDVVVRLGGTINEATDTVSVIERRRGGSAANVAVAATALGQPARFLGQVGIGAIGDVLIGEMSAAGVDVGCVRRGGRVATIVVLVDRTGERTMLSDRGAAIELSDPEATWLDGVTTLHVPMYSLDGEPLASTTSTLIAWAHERRIVVSIDVSSVELIERLGADRVRALLDEARPHVVFANGDEASALGVTGEIAGAVTVVKHGADPVEIFAGGRRTLCDVPPIEVVGDTTGAGDAFAAGFLSKGLDEVEVAVRAGTAAAARLIGTR